MSTPTSAGHTRDYAIVDLGPGGNSELTVRHADGTLARVLTTGANGSDFSSVSWSPDDQTLAYCDGQGLVVQPAAGGPETVLVPNVRTSMADGVGDVTVEEAAWSPGADEIAYLVGTRVSATVSSLALMVIKADGTGLRTVEGPFVSDSAAATVQTSRGGVTAWTADGAKIAFEESSYQNHHAFDFRVVAVPAGGEGPEQELLPPAQVRVGFALSPDGSRIAYVRDAVGANHADLVTRDLTTGAETIVLSDANMYNTRLVDGAPSWSADSTQLAFLTDFDYGTSNAVVTLNAAKVDGTGPITPVFSPHSEGLRVFAWANAPMPNLYIDRVEVAQAISPYADNVAWAPPAVDPTKAVNTSPAKLRDTLVAGKDTFARIYVSSSLPGTRKLKKLSVRLTATRGGADLGSLEAAPALSVNRASARERQGDTTQTVNFTLPLKWADGTITLRADINTDGAVTECDGCLSQGNSYVLDAVPFRPSGHLHIHPYLFRFTWGSKSVEVPPSFPESAIRNVLQELPVAARNTTVDPPRVLTLDASSLKAPLSGQPINACNEMYEVMEAMSLSLTPVPGDVNVGFFRPAGEGLGAPAGFIDTCAGRGALGGPWAVVGENTAADRFRPDTLAHELGHTAGLPHAFCPKPTTRPSNSVRLPYSQIDGVGYSPLDVARTVTLRPSDSEDLMSYCDTRWTSPVTWERMFRAFGGNVGPATKVTPFASQSGAAARARESARSVRSSRHVSGTVLVVKGVLYHGRAYVYGSYPMDGATLPPSPAPALTLLRVAAWNAQGRRLAQVPVARWSDSDPSNGSGAQLFLAALPIDHASTFVVTVTGRNGKLLGTSRAPAHSPRLALTDLAKPRTVSSRRVLTVRWRGSDHQKLTYTVLVATGHGGFRIAAADVPTTRVSLQLWGYRAGTKLRIRVIASYGLRYTTATSAQLTVR